MPMLQKMNFKSNSTPKANSEGENCPTHPLTIITDISIITLLVFLSFFLFLFFGRFVGTGVAP